MEIDVTVIAIIVTAVGTAIIAGVVLIKNRLIIKQFLQPLIARYNERRNNRIKNENDKKAQKMLNEKITRAELIDIINTIYEMSENINTIAVITLCMLIQTINEPDSQTLSNYMRRRSLRAKYNINDIERWLDHLWSDDSSTGELSQLSDNIKQLKKKIEELNSETS